MYILYTLLQLLLIFALVYIYIYIFIYKCKVYTNCNNIIMNTLSWE